MHEQIKWKRPCFSPRFFFLTTDRQPMGTTSTKKNENKKNPAVQDSDLHFPDWWLELLENPPGKRNFEITTEQDWGFFRLPLEVQQKIIGLVKGGENLKISYFVLLFSLLFPGLPSFLFLLLSFSLFFLCLLLFFFFGFLSRSFFFFVLFYLKELY